jgi:hypothetical protein
LAERRGVRAPGPWAAWTVETNAEATVLDVRSTGPAVATLHGTFWPG